MKITVPWLKKKTMTEKIKIRQKLSRRDNYRYPKRQLLQAMTKKELRLYCIRRGFTVNVRHKIQCIYNGGYITDTRDYRKVLPEDRCPRSLNVPPSPPGFWDI